MGARSAGRHLPPRVASHSGRALGAWLLLLGVAGALLLLQRPAPAGAQTEELTTAERRQAGQIYALQCASCHGAEGQGAVVPGTNREAPPLAGPDGVSVPYVDLVLRTGRMPPPENPFDNRARRVIFSDRQRAILVAWIAEEFDLPGDIPNPPPGDAAEGLDVWTQNCSHCHGATGAGGVAGAGAWTPSVVQYGPVAMAEAIRVGPFEMPQFEQEQISNEEVGDVSAFIEEVRTEEGTPILGIIELNPVFASAFVALLAVVTLVLVVVVAGKPTWFPDPEAEGPSSGGEESS